MAVLDPRLLPLLETLASAGVDWLAFEIVDGVNRGREALESEELLQAAREKVRSRQPSDRLSVGIPVLPEPLLGDDQIVWAANYVTARLDGALADLEEGYTMIEAIAEDSDRTLEQADSAFPEVHPGDPVQVVLIGQESHPIDRGSITIAREKLVFLKNTLARWSFEVRSNTTQ